MSHATPPGAPAGSRRFWVTVILFALANLAGWVGYHQYSTSRLHLLRVVRFEPGHEAVVYARPTFSWEFNLDVAHGRADAPPPGVITPHVAGRWLWRDGRTLTFVPDADLPRATRFTIALPSDRIRTAEGIQLDKAFSETISTPPLQLLGVRQGGFDEAGRLVVELEFNDTVIPADAIRHLKITEPDFHPVTFSLFGEAAGKIIRVRTDALPGVMQRAVDRFVMVDVSAGLAGAGGPLGIAQPSSHRVEIDADLIATEAFASAPARGSAELGLRFNNAVDTESLRHSLSVEPAVPFQVVSRYYGAALMGDFQPGTRYAIKIAAPAAGSDPKKYPRADTLSVFVPDRSPQVWFEHNEGYLGTSGNRTLLAHAVNLSDLKVTVTRLYDSNLVVWRNTSDPSRWYDPNHLAQPIATETISLKSVKNQQQDVKVSLDDLLPADAPRDGVYRVGLAADTSGRSVHHRDGRWIEDGDSYDATSAVVTLSDIGLTAKQSAGTVNVWAVSLSTAKPLEGARVRVYSNKNQLLGEASTDADGLAAIAHIKPASGESPAVLLAEMAETGARVAGEAIPAANKSSPRGLTWLDLRRDGMNFAAFDTAGKPYLRNGHEAFIYTERGVYRPGETLHLRAIVRGAELNVPGGFPVRWQLRRPDLRDWKSEVVTIDGDGAAAMDVSLPSDLPTGHWSAELALPGENGRPGQSFGSVSFQVEEFVPNRMKVKLDVTDGIVKAEKATDRLSIGAGPLSAKVQADYLFGKPVSERPATLVARIDAAVFSPGKWEGWTFHDAANTAQVFTAIKSIGGRIELPEITLDDKGQAKWEIDPESIMNPEQDDAPKPQRRAPRAKGQKAPPPAAPAQEYPGPWRVTFATAVTEAGGRAVNASRAVDIDRAPYYVGLRPTKSTAVPGEPLDFELARVSPGGSVAPVGGDVKSTLYRETWNTTLVNEQGSYRYVSTRKLDAVGKEYAAAVSGGRASCRVTPPSGGSYVLVVRDATTGCVASRAFFASTGAWEDNVSREDPEKLELVVVPAPRGTIETLKDAAQHFETATFYRLWHHGALASPPRGEQKFRAGETAQVIVRAPFAGRLMLTVETDSVLGVRVIDMPASHVTVPIEISDRLRPNAYVAATIVRAIDTNAQWRPHRAFGIARIPVDNTDHRLAVKIAAPEEVRPAHSLGVELRVTDTLGRPTANAAVTVAAVDEGILTLTSYTTPDPFGFFTARRAHGVRATDIYSQLMPEVARPQRESAVGGDSDAPAPARHQTPVTAKRVRPVSLISGTLHTDAAGVARADFPIPEFAGQLRVMAVAHEGNSFGSSEGNVFVRSPLLVQGSWPRFAAPEDRFTVPLVVFNNTKSAGKAEIRVMFSEGKDEKSPYPLYFPAGKDQELVLATGEIAPGAQATLSFEVAARAQCGVAAVSIMSSLNGEFFSESIELPVRPASPAISIGGYGVASTTQPAKIGVVGGMLAGTQELQVRAAPFPQLELPRGLEYLDRYPYGCAEQTVSGCFPLVTLGDIGRQIAPGVCGPKRIEEKLQSGITRLIGMQCADGGISMWAGSHEKSWPWASVYAAHFLVEAGQAGHKVPEDFRDALLKYVRGLLNQSTDAADVVEVQAYACYVLALAGKPERAVMSRLGEILNTVKTVKVGYYQPGPEARFHLAAAWLAAGRRDLAAGLIPQTLPQPRSQRQLGGNVGSGVRDRAVLVSTLLAVDPDHPLIPAMVQQLADAGKERGWQSTQDAAFAVMAIGSYLRQLKPSDPYDTAQLVLDNKIAFADVTDGKPLVSDPVVDANAALEVRIFGTDKARAYVSWLQSGVPIKPPADVDAGMKIRRRYLNAHGEAIADNTVRGGDLVQVEITIEALTALEHVVIDDLLPAGLEIENARLETGANASQVEEKERQQTARFSHGRIDIRDDRLIVVGTFTGGGKGTFTYLARAVAPGEFAIPPVRGECMYDIGTHSLSGAGKRLRVVPVSAASLARVNSN